ncbi:MAG TPA: hypothetical protein VMM83_02135 [Longimicrobiales bacterium]|nr:hypothetical protein [Longimicrobiales bacterium]
MFARTASFLVLVAAAAPAAAQTTVIDEGSFRLSIKGTPIGTETFAIRRTGTGDAATLIAQGRIVLDTGEQTRALLQVEGPGLRPSAYQIEVTGPETQSIRGQAAGNRFRATIVSTAGETMREYLASEGAVVLDDGVAHQHYFLAEAAGDGGAVPIIIPRQSRQVSASVTNAGSDNIRVGGGTVAARRLEIEPAGLPLRIVWVDSQGRVLRLEIPDNDFVAERTALP